MTNQYNPTQISSQSCFFTKTSCQQNCQNHQFSFISISRTSALKNTVKISLCPFTNKSKSIVQNIWPQANFDGKPHFPAFSLQIDKIPMLLSQDDFLKTFSNKLQESLKQPEQILQPNPGLDKRRCNVCKFTFDDYKIHVRSRIHKRNIKRSSFEYDILQMELEYLENNEVLKNKDDIFYVKKIKKLKRILNDSDRSRKVGSQTTIKLSQKEEIQKKEQLKIPRMLGGMMDQQQQVSVIKKSQQKTQLNVSSVY